MGAPKMSEMKRRFAELYDGNGAQSAKRAGCKGDLNSCGVQAMRWLKDPEVQKLIEARRQREIRVAVADRLELQELWSGLARDGSNPLPERLRASELLARSHGMFLVRIDATVRRLELPPGLTVEELRALARRPLTTEQTAAPTDAVPRDDDKPEPH